MPATRTAIYSVKLDLNSASSGPPIPCQSLFTLG
jgi:hypothetical protein